MTLNDDSSPADRLFSISMGLARSLEAAIHFVENADRLTGPDPASPWPDWYPDGYIGLIDAVARWYELLANPNGHD